VTASVDPPKILGRLLDIADLASVVESDRFKDFLERLPIAIAVSKLRPDELIIYANEPIERLTGKSIGDIVGGGWESLQGQSRSRQDQRDLGEFLVGIQDDFGAYVMTCNGVPLRVNAWSHVIEDDDSTPAFRIVALVPMVADDGAILDELQQRVEHKDLQLRELQHRVKNNLQMITALIRVEAKGISDRSLGEGYDRLAGRVEALGLLYKSLGDGGSEGTVDLGIYLGEIATAVMSAHAAEGIRLDMRVDTWRVSIDVAMPAGLVVNELLTNSLKHAFVGRQGGTITLQSTNLPSGCKVVVADDGVGLPPGVSWPKPGKLSALIVRSLKQNAKAHIEIQSAPGEGARVTIVFSPEDAV
jgi:two-component sensor histidine kinase